MAEFQVGSTFHAGTQIQIKGLRQVLRRLRAAGVGVESMKELNHRVGMIVVNNAVVPTDSSQLAGTLRAGRGATKAVVRAGYASRAPYAGVRHYGDPHRPGHTAAPFLTDSLRASQGAIVQEYENGIDEILRKHNLK